VHVAVPGELVVALGPQVAARDSQHAPARPPGEGGGARSVSSWCCGQRAAVGASKGRQYDEGRRT
jgi:hypothetical protein